MKPPHTQASAGCSRNFRGKDERHSRVICAPDATRTLACACPAASSRSNQGFQRRHRHAITGDAALGHKECRFTLDASLQSQRRTVFYIYCICEMIQ